MYKIHMFKNRKLCFIAACLFLSLLLLPSVSFAAPDKSPIDMEVKGGYSDTAIIGAYTPFQVTLLNKGEEFEGELQIIISINEQGRSMYAMPVVLPKGSSKVLKMDVPVQTVGRKVEVRLSKGNKIVKKYEYKLNKIVSPDIPVIAVLSDDPGAFAGLNGIKVGKGLSSDMSDEMQKRYGRAAISRPGTPVETAELTERPAELIYLDSSTMPDNSNSLNAFDLLIISNFDTSGLSSKQSDALSSWVKGGKNLFICTGSNWKKVYAGLNNELKPFKIDNTLQINTSKSMEAFTGIKNPLEALTIASGNAANGSVVLKEGSYPLSMLYKSGAGTISVLTFDPTISPVTGWPGEQAMWKGLINEALKANASSLDNNYMKANFLSNLQHMASNVPETQTPPLLTLLGIIGLYILIVGPIIYLILKFRDKRDWNWVIIPAAAILFMGIIYTAGFKTRFSTAVLNNVSIMEVNGSSGSLGIQTLTGAFNNTKGTMKIKYDNSLSLNMDFNRYYNYYSYSPNQDELSKKVISKKTFAEAAVLELYDVPMWQPRYVNISKTESAKGAVLDSASISDGKFKARVRNTTRFAFKDSFVIIGNNYVKVGNLLPGEEKTIAAEFGTSSAQKNLNSFLDSVYDQKYYYSPSGRPSDWREKYRKRELLSSFLQNTYINSQGYSKILFCALNNDDFGYSLEINGKKPKVFNSNIVYSEFDFNFEKGQKVEIPSGIIKPEVMSAENGMSFDHYMDSSNQGIRAHTDGDIHFVAKLPDSVSVDSFNLLFSSSLTSYIKYQNNSRTTYTRNSYKYFIYNNSKSAWEEIKEKHTVHSNISSYINNKGEIKLKVNVTLNKSGSSEELLNLPDIELSGVAK